MVCDAQLGQRVDALGQPDRGEEVPDLSASGRVRLDGGSVVGIAGHEERSVLLSRSSWVQAQQRSQPRGGKRRAWGRNYSDAWSRRTAGADAGSMVPSPWERGGQGLLPVRRPCSTERHGYTGPVAAVARSA